MYKASKGNENGFIPIPKYEHNKNMVSSAEGNAKYARKHPSELEKKMKDLLDGSRIQYEFQKVIYIKSFGGFIKQYFIVDFFIPSRDIIIEVHGKPSEEQQKYASERKKAIKKAYPLYAIVDWYRADFNSYTKMKKLVDFLEGI
jgi:very-short-patch-repair endonuclease